MKKTHRIALRPTPEQESLFGQHAGYARFAYNWAVGEFKAGLDVGEWMSEKTLRPRWNRVKQMIAPWTADLSQNAAKYAIIDFGQAAGAWGAYRKRLKAGHRPGRRVGFPRFKRRKHEQGFRADNGPGTVRLDGKAVILPKIGRIEMVEALRFSGSVREVTINRTAGTRFACFAMETGEAFPPVKDGETVGVDVGVGTLAVCSNGLEVENPKALKTALPRLRQVDKAIARSKKVHGKTNHSNRRERLYSRREKAMEVVPDCGKKRVVVSRPTLGLAGFLGYRSARTAWLGESLSWATEPVQQKPPPCRKGLATHQSGRRRDERAITPLPGT